MPRELYVLIEKDENGFYVGEVPQLKACYAQGRAIDQLIDNIREVIDLCLEETNDLIFPEFVGVQKVNLDEPVMKEKIILIGGGGHCKSC